MYPTLRCVFGKETQTAQTSLLAGAAAGCGQVPSAQARALAEEDFSDPNWSSLAFGRRYFEREKEMFGANIWPTGLSANRKNLERFMMYSRDQGLIKGDYAVEDLLAPSVRDT